MKAINFLLLLLMQTAGFSQHAVPEAKHFTLKGYFLKSTIKKVFIRYYNGNKVLITDSSYVKNNSFYFTGKIGGPTNICMYSYLKGRTKGDSISTDFYVEPQQITLTIRGDNFDEIVLNEAETKRETNFLLEEKSFLTEKRDSAITKLSYFTEVLNSAGSSAIGKNILYKIDSLNNYIDKLIKQETGIEIAFIKAHRYSFTAIDLLRYRIYKQPEFPNIDSIDQLYNTLSIMVQKSSKGRDLQALIAKVKRNQVGQSAPYFELTDLSGEALSQINFQHSKYVLLDFWASWCIPCRHEFPQLKEMYKKYSLKGLEIISISTDLDTSAYLKAVKKDGINIWKNALKNEQIMNAYHVPALPTKYLINKEGIIVGRWRGGGQENLDSLIKILESIL